MRVDINNVKAEFACRVCMAKYRNNEYPDATDCAWRAFDNEYCAELVKVIGKDLTPKKAQDRPEARWKGAGLGDNMCSNCLTVFSGGDEYNFCPYCGAYMQ